MAKKFVCSPRGSVETNRRRLGRGLTLLSIVVLAVAILLLIKGVYGSAVIMTLVGLLTAYAARMSRDLDLMWIELESKGKEGEEVTLQLRHRRLRRPFPDFARHLTDEEAEHLRRLTRWSGFQVATGGYDSRLLGEIELYTSNLDRPVLLGWQEEGVVVTPDDAQGLVDLVQAHHAPVA